MENIKLSVVIPFTGFYESDHNAILCDVIEREAEYLQEEGATDEEIGNYWELYHNGLQWRQVCNAYAKEYVEELEHFINEEIKTQAAMETKLPVNLEFEELTSPREYNFTTDRIFCKIDRGAVIYMFESVDTPKLREKIKERFTSYDGFISFYPNTLEEWAADVTTWDANQLGVLLEVFVELLIAENTESELNEALQAYSIMERTRDNGGIDEIIWQNVSKEFNEYDELLKGKYIK